MPQIKLFRPGEDDGPAADDAPRTVGEVVSLYLLHTQRDANPRTFADRRRILLTFAAEHGTLPLAECRAHHLRLWVDQHEEWASDWTRKRVVSTVKTAFTWAGKMGFLAQPSNPFASVTQRAGERGQPMRPEHFRKLLRGTDALFRRFLIFLVFSGCRPGEAASARWTEIDWERGLLVKVQHKTARTSKDRRPRVIVLHHVLLKLLRWMWRRRLPGQEFVFVNYRGLHWQRAALSLRMMRLRKRCGVPTAAKLHGIRHFWATQALLRGVDVVAVSHLLGHASLKTTQIYEHCAQNIDYLRASVEKAMRDNSSG